MELEDDGQRRRSWRRGTFLRRIVGGISITLGAGLFLATTLWLAKSDTKNLRYSSIITLTFGILTGIFQLGSTIILCLMSLETHWTIFVWTTFTSFVGCLVVFIFSIVEIGHPDYAQNASNEDKGMVEETILIIISGLNVCLCGGFLLAHFPKRVAALLRKHRGVEATVPYDVLE